MTGYLTDFKGGVWRLPTIISWDMSHTLGSPADAFEISFLYEKTMLPMLSGAIRFLCDHEGETVFKGVVDEFEVSADGGGLVATVRGRGLAALLLDNEAEAGEYCGATLQYILDRHVYPWGVPEVRCGTLPAVTSFSVASGASHWRVLEDFAWFCGGVRPRFSRDGVLLLNGEKGKDITVSASTAMSSFTYREKRYGVISQVLVKNKSRNISSTVDNAQFLERGGASRRVVTVPRNTYHDAMRHTGRYQIEQSELGSTVCELTLATIFAAFPGDTVKITDSVPGVTGDFEVAESRCWADGRGAGTVLTLERI